MHRSAAVVTPTLHQPDYLERNQRAFARLAPFYDLVTVPLRRLRRDVVRWTGIVPGMRVIDVATGTGAQALAFADAGADVTAVDVSPAMLEVALRRDRRHRVRFVEADAAQLPFASGSFDVACISFGLHEMPGAVRDQVVREMVRVTRPGGTVVVVDYVLPSHAIAAAVVERAVRVYESQHYVGFVHADLRAMLEEAGIAIREDRRAALGAVRIAIGTRR
jgi:demethylmenaquinone methyltransferase/2-methoxy-6-polyprenyl-1,4-benzoquinol methylase